MGLLPMVCQSHRTLALPIFLLPLPPSAWRLATFPEMARRSWRQPICTRHFIAIPLSGVFAWTEATPSGYQTGWWGAMFGWTGQEFRKSDGFDLHSAF